MSFWNLCLQLDIIANWQATWIRKVRRCQRVWWRDRELSVTGRQRWTNHTIWVLARVVPLPSCMILGKSLWFLLSQLYAQRLYELMETMCVKMFWKSIKHYTNSNFIESLFLLLQWCPGQERMIFTFHGFNCSKQKNNLHRRLSRSLLYEFLWGKRDGQFSVWFLKYQPKVFQDMDT